MFILSQYRRFRRGLMSFRRGGFRWTGFAEDVDVTWQVYTYDEYQGSALRGLLGWLARNGWLSAHGYALDVGANIGTTALPLARDHGYRVLAIEPSPQVFEVLERNVVQNGLGARIACVRAAVAPEPGTAELMIPFGSSARGELARPGPLPQDGIAEVGVRGRVEVRTAPLAQLLDERSIEPADVAFVWSDAQGADGHVIATAPALWEAGVPLYMELWPDGLRHQGAYDPVAAAAAYGFSGFIPKRDLIDHESPRLRQWSELPAFMDACGEGHGDVLMVPQRRREGHNR